MSGTIPGPREARSPGPMHTPMVPWRWNPVGAAARPGIASRYDQFHGIGRLKMIGTCQGRRTTNHSLTRAQACDETSVRFKACCRFCAAPLKHTFADLGLTPLCQTHIEPEQLSEPERFYPLHALVCERCWLVQLQEFVSPAEIFSEYAYFSSYSDSWVEHARCYADHMRQLFGIGRESLVVELASNDGYLLQHFVRAGIPVLGVEPAANVAEVAIQKGVRTEVQFFGRNAAERIAT